MGMAKELLRAEALASTNGVFRASAAKAPVISLEKEIAIDVKPRRCKF
jgi:hypothetical protein